MYMRALVDLSACFEDFEGFLCIAHLSRSGLEAVAKGSSVPMDFDTIGFWFVKNFFFHSKFSSFEIFDIDICREISHPGVHYSVTNVRRRYVDRT